MHKKYYSHDEIVQMLKDRYFKDIPNHTYDEVAKHQDKYTLKIFWRGDEYVSLEIVENSENPS